MFPHISNSVGFEALTASRKYLANISFGLSVCRYAVSQSVDFMINLKLFFLKILMRCCQYDNKTIVELFAETWEQAFSEVVYIDCVCMDHGRGFVCGNPASSLTTAPSSVCLVIYHSRLSQT